MGKHSLFTSSFDKSIMIFCCKFFGLFGTMTLLFLFVVMPQYSESYTAGLIDKINRLKDINEPKIILVGNSNLAFGIRSNRLEEEFNMPVVNLGMHGGFGNAFHEEMAKINVCEGDIYIVCHTDYSDLGIVNDGELVCNTLENNFQLWRLLHYKDITKVMEAFPTYFQKSLKLWLKNEGNKVTDETYTRGYFDEYGDYDVNRPKRVINLSEGMIVVPKINDICCDRLNNLNDYLNKRGATLLVAAYAIPACEFTPDVSEYEAFQRELQTKLQVPVISNYAEYMLDQDYFFDTEYHLTDEGAVIRTNMLIDDLRKWRENSDKNR